MQRIKAVCFGIARRQSRALGGCSSVAPLLQAKLSEGRIEGFLVCRKKRCKVKPQLFFAPPHSALSLMFCSGYVTAPLKSLFNLVPTADFWGFWARLCVATNGKLKGCVCRKKKCKARRIIFIAY